MNFTCLEMFIVLYDAMNIQCRVTRRSSLMIAINISNSASPISQVGDSLGTLLWNDALRMVCLGTGCKAGLKEKFIRQLLFSSNKNVS